MRELIYVAGPYTKGDVAMNVRNAIDAGNRLSELGFVPFIPHLVHFWHMIFPHSYDFWCDYDNQFVPLCKGILRLPGESAGSDAEVALSKSLSIPVFDSINALDRHFAETAQPCTSPYAWPNGIRSVLPVMNVCGDPSQIEAEAAALVNGDRQAAYGSPLLNHQRIADFWSVRLGDKLKEPITPGEAAEMMVLVKIARLMHSFSEDSVRDIVGYAKVREMIEAAQAGLKANVN